MYIIPHLYVVKHSWSFEILNFHMLNFQSFKISHFWNCECLFHVFNKSLSSHIFYHQFIIIIWFLWKSFVKMPFFNDLNFHFQKFSTKPKLKIGSNVFLIWFSWHSCVSKMTNVLWYHSFKWQKKKSLVFYDWI
jgi:hypothetical protein